MKKFKFMLAAWFIGCSPMTVGNPILDVMDWEIPDELQSVLVPDVQECISLDALREQMEDESVQQKTNPAAKKDVPKIPGAWNAALWREYSFWDEDVSLPIGRDVNLFLDRLTLADWIGISEYRDVRNSQIYRIDESMLTVPEPGELILPMVILGGVIWVVWYKRKGAQDLF